jgi:amino acid transporter
MSASAVSDRPLSIIETIALSLALIGPTLVLAANGQTIALTVRQPLWLVFAIGLLGIGSVGHAFARLVPLTNGPGSAFVAVQATLGLWPGRLAGVSLLGAYLGFSLATPAAILSFLDTVGRPIIGVAVLPRIIAVSGTLALAGFLTTRPNTTIMRTLLVVEGVGIALIILLAVAVLQSPVLAPRPMMMPASAPAGMLHLLDGVVVAFFSWAGFESCMTLAGNSRNPRREMPIALALSVLVSGALFIAMFAVIEHGFASRLGGRAALAVSENALSDLGRIYLGAWSGAAFGVAAICSAFACLVAAITAAGSILGSLYIKDRPLPSRRVPILIAASVWVVQCLVSLPGPLAAIMPTSAIGLYGLFGGAGAICVMIAYFLVLAGNIRAIATGAVNAARWELLIPLAGLTFIIFALFGVVTSSGPAAFSTLLAICFCTVALLIPVNLRRMRTPGVIR